VNVGVGTPCCALDTENASKLGHFKDRIISIRVWRGKAELCCFSGISSYNFLIPLLVVKKIEVERESEWKKRIYTNYIWNNSEV
jgi:hypothetical protein